MLTSFPGINRGSLAVVTTPVYPRNAGGWGWGGVRGTGLVKGPSPLRNNQLPLYHQYIVSTYLY